MTSSQVLISVLGGAGVVLVALLAASLYTVEQQTVAVVQRLGKFVGTTGPGIHAKIPLIDKIAGRVNLRVQQLDVGVETKTEDNVFLHMIVSVQYFVLPEKAYESFYKLDDASRQIKSYVFDVVRGHAPGQIQGLFRSVVTDGEDRDEEVVRHQGR